jgi:hypothetical protein
MSSDTKRSLHTVLQSIPPSKKLMPDFDDKYKRNEILGQGGFGVLFCFFPFFGHFTIHRSCYISRDGI